MLADFSLAGRTAIVTGGARGLGREMLLALAAAGANVAAVDLLVDQAQETVAQAVRDHGVAARAYTADVTQPDQIERAFAAIETDLGPADVLIAAAGISAGAPAEEFTLQMWQRLIDVNLTGVFICAQAAGRRMIARGKGSIILIASMSGSIANHLQRTGTGYNSAKAGVVMLGKCLASEWADRGVRVNTVSPGYFHSHMTEPSILNNPEEVTAWCELTPLGRLGRPAELRGLAVYLASDASSFMTGSDLLIDGGYTAW
jgi:NAD(P)-dependent dehydrogenase (short-subunit alcohol dehydrogenase family)